MANFRVYADQEIAAVVKYLNDNNIKFKAIRKWCMQDDEVIICKKWAADLGVSYEFEPDPLLVERCGKECFSDGDVVVELESGDTILFEVQEDRQYNPNNKYRKINLDAFSVFFFKDDKYRRGDSIQPEQYEDFLNHITIRKLGKIDYCNSDVLLFWHKDDKGKIDFVEGYDFQLLKKCFIKEFCNKYCTLRINMKKDTGNGDKYESAVYKVNAFYLRKFKINKFETMLNYRKRNLTNFDKLRITKGYIELEDNKYTDEELKQKIFDSMLYIKKVA